ncbi:MAG: dienelactone hydrolase-like enzyme, partial [Ilumatobacteraceae bacterium]|nr:dienelactone hydrolase-like enzyme [Ilumatobacteraceae bacterium]
LGMHLRRPILAILVCSSIVAACSSEQRDAGTTPARAASTTATTAATATTTIAATTAATPPSVEPTQPTAATDAPTTTEPESTTTTEDPAALADEYEAAGPYPVGVTTATMANGIQVEIWYPAVAGSDGTETYDVRDFTAPAIKAILTADIPATYSYPATRDAAVADGSFPVVVNSHGYSGIRVGSSFLTSHLASWGIIVVSPDHPTRDLYHAVAQIQPDVVTDPVDDLLGSLDLITARSTTAGDMFEGHVDTDHVGALGHSAGGGTVVGAALDPRIDGYVSMASGLPRDSTGATTVAVLPDKPSFFLSGALDGVADPVRTHDAFEAVPTPSLFWKIDGVGHNGFDDFCTFGNGTSIIGIAEASGLGALLDAQPTFRKLGEDGCKPPDAPVGTTFPIIDHAVTAFFLHLFDVDATPKGLDSSVVDSYSEKITIEQR